MPKELPCCAYVSFLSPESSYEWFRLQLFLSLFSRYSLNIFYHLVWIRFRASMSNINTCNSTEEDDCTRHSQPERVRALCTPCQITSILPEPVIYSTGTSQDQNNYFVWSLVAISSNSESSSPPTADLELYPVFDPALILCRKA